MALASKGEIIDEQRSDTSSPWSSLEMTTRLPRWPRDVVCITAKGKPIKAKTIGQQKYMKAIQKNTITVGGVLPVPAKPTWLWPPPQPLSGADCELIILTRPAVEAGGAPGLLPGDPQNKVDPYLRPLHDALYDMLGPETYQKYLSGQH